MGTMDEELQILRTRAEEAVRLQSELKKVIANTDRVEALYQQEQASPKKKNCAYAAQSGTLGYTWGRGGVKVFVL